MPSAKPEPEFSEKILTVKEFSVIIEKMVSELRCSILEALMIYADKNGVELETIGIRPGEKFHEVLISEEESRDAWDLGDKFMISNSNWVKDEEVLNSHKGKIKKISYDKEYSSENVEKISVEKIQELIQPFKE